MTKTTNLQQTYHVMVTEASTDYTNEWIGKVSLMPQENGDIYISISFKSETDICAGSTRQSAINRHRISIDSI